MNKLNKHQIIAIGVLLLILILESALTGLLPLSRGRVFNFLELHSSLVWGAIFVYFFNYFFIDLFQALKGYTVIITSLLFRTIRTRSVLAEPIDGDILNTPQRIQEDIKFSYLYRITVWSEYFVSSTILIYLVIQNMDTPILIFSALGYAAISVVIAILFNPALTHAERNTQEQEATFRRYLSENLSMRWLTEANLAEKKAAKVRLGYVLFTRLQLGLLNVLPYMVLITPFFAGDITLGTLVQHQATFSLVVINAAILIQMYTVWIKGNASESRVKKLEDK